MSSGAVDDVRLPRYRRADCGRLQRRVNVKLWPTRIHNHSFGSAGNHHRWSLAGGARLVGELERANRETDHAEHAVMVRAQAGHRSVAPLLDVSQTNHRAPPGICSFACVLVSALSAPASRFHSSARWSDLLGKARQSLKLLNCSAALEALNGDTSPPPLQKVYGTSGKTGFILRTQFPDRPAFDDFIA